MLRPTGVAAPSSLAAGSCVSSLAVSWEGGYGSVGVVGVVVEMGEPFALRAPPLCWLLSHARWSGERLFGRWLGWVSGLSAVSNSNSSTMFETIVWGEKWR
jgi:hypothetical protein